MMEEYDKINGVVLHLFKRRLFQNISDQKHYDYMMFGFYDGLRLIYPKSWLDFGPEGIDNLLLEDGKQPINRADFSGVYSIKLLFPRKNSREEMVDRYGFNYDLWNKNYIEREPLFAALLLKATKNFVLYTNNLAKQKNGKYRLSSVAESIWDAMKRADLSEKDMKLLNCGLFQCLGYYDYALLFQSNDWGNIYKIADNLKQYVIEIDSCKSTHFIASDYLLLGMNSKEDSYKKISPNSSFRMSIEVKVNPGYSFIQFWQAFIRNLMKRDGKNSSSVNFWKNHAKFYRYNGSADCIIITDERDAQNCSGIKYVLREFDQEGLLAPGSNFFNRYVANIHTSALTSSQNNIISDCIDINDTNELEKMDTIGTKFANWTKDMRETYRWGNDSAFIRRVHGVEDLIAQGKNLLGGKACFDIERIMIPAYEMLITSLNELKKLYTSNYGREDLINKNYCKKWKARTYQFLSDFRMYVGEFQDSLQFSDRNFIESVRIKHSSIGTSTKLILVYNELINRFVTEMDSALKKFEEELWKRKKTEIIDETKSNASMSLVERVLFTSDNAIKKGKIEPFRWIDSSKIFLVTCGGQDKAEVINLSEGIPSADNSGDSSEDRKNCQIEDSLVIMRMPERSIFDIRGTIFRMFHEIWHLCGHRKRTDRCVFVMLDAIQRLSVVIANTMINQNVILNIVHDCILGIEQEKWDSIVQTLRGIIKGAILNFSEKINDSMKSIEYQLNEEVRNQRQEKGSIKDFFYRNKIVNMLIDITVEEFLRNSCQNTYKPDLWQDIYSAYQEETTTMYKTIEEYLLKEFGDQIDIADISDIIWKQEINIRDTLIEENIREVLSFLATGMVGVSDNNCATNGIAWRKWFQDCQVNKVYEFLFEVYSETFCDYMTCHTIGRESCFQKEDYVMFFIYSNDDIDIELANTELNIFRIGTILELFFECDVNNPLQLDRERLKELYIESFKDSEQIIEEKIEEIEQAMARIWTSYQRGRKYTNHLHTYLKVDYLYNTMDNIENSVDVVKNIRGIFKAAGEIKSHEDVMNMVKELLHVWASIASE